MWLLKKLRSLWRSLWNAIKEWGLLIIIIAALCVVFFPVAAAALIGSLGLGTITASAVFAAGLGTLFVIAAVAPEDFIKAVKKISEIVSGVVAAVIGPVLGAVFDIVSDAVQSSPVLMLVLGLFGVVLVKKAAAPLPQARQA